MSAEFTPTTEQVREVFALALVPSDGDQTVPEDEFDRWLAAHDREVQAQTLKTAADFLATKNLTSSADGVHIVEWLNGTAAALRNSDNEGKEPQVGDVVPLREERCDTKHEGPFRLTSSGNGSSSVHYCTLQQGHGGKHYDGVSGQDWRG